MLPPSMENALSLNDENTLRLADKRFVFKYRTEAWQESFQKQPGDVRQGMSDFKTAVDLHALRSLSVLVGSYHLHMSV